MIFVINKLDIKEKNKDGVYQLQTLADIAVTVPLSCHRLAKPHF